MNTDELIQENRGHIANGDPYCRKCGGLGTYEKDIGDAVAHLICPCTYQESQPLRTSYSREEIAAKMKDWMIETWGHPMGLSEENRNRWMERNGMLYAFICDNFPIEPNRRCSE